MDTIELAALNLKITLSKTQVSAGEAPSGIIELTNAGASELETASLVNRNNVLKLSLKKPDGTIKTRDPHEVEHTKGVHVHERKVDLIKLQPGKSTNKEISIAEWFGSLTEPGEYSLTATYVWGMECRANSLPVKFTVVGVQITSLVRADDGGRLAAEPRDLLWTSPVSTKDAPKGVVDLTRARHEPAAPTAILSSEFVAQIPAACVPVATVSDVARGKFSGVFWRVAPGAYRLVKFNKAGKAAGAQDFMFPDAEFVPLGSPWCDVEGSIWVFFRNGDGTQAGFITLPPTGVATPARTFALSVPLGPSVCVRWGRSEALHLAFESEVGGTVYAQSIPLTAPTPPPAVVIAQTKPPIRVYHTRVDELFEKETSTFRKFYTLLLHDDVRDMFIRRRVDAAGQTLKEETFLMPGTGFWRVIDCAMLADDTVGYLFADAKGQVYFGPSDLSKSEPLKGLYAEPLTTASSPCLLPGGGDTRTAKFYLAFISQGTKIVRRIAGR
ncbi:MAG: hypothetical protein NTV94_04815 [Planctomycetota bacterium]|nr:hypothetical protein [Planctomycetota bacterium]